MPFDSPDLNLGTLLNDAHTGKLQLPDFQRPWKWDTDRITGLLTSISLGYPVGVVMLLELGGDEVSFQPRPISGAPAAEQPPDSLILDGQQRLTSLYQSLRSGEVVDTADPRGKRLKRWYFLDIDRSLDGDDREDAVIATPEDQKLKANFDRDVVADYSTTELQASAGVFPLWLTFDNQALFPWVNAYTAAGEGRMARWTQFYDRVLSNLIGYTVPVIVLKKDTRKEAVCTVFEKVNTGGVVLNVFELLTATFAASDFRLGEDWDARRATLNEQPTLHAIENTDFLQVVALLAAIARNSAHDGPPDSAPGVGCKRRNILNLTLEEYQAWAPEAETGLIRAAKFLSNARIFRSKDIPYKTQLVPLAAILAQLGGAADTHGNAQQIRRWYWCGVFGELYGGATESRFAKDAVEVPRWVKGGEPPSTVVDAAFAPERLLTLRTRNSAAYKGVHALVMNGCRDWQFDNPIDLATFWQEPLDIHHIFPRAWCNKNGIDDGRRECIVNKTAISASTNRTLGGRAPSEYLKTIADTQHAGLPDDEIDELLATHAIDPVALRTDDFDLFFHTRRAALLGLIEQAMEKPINLAELEGIEAPDEFEPLPPEIDEEPGGLVSQMG